MLCEDCGSIAVRNACVYCVCCAMAPFITEIPHTRTTILGDDTHHFLVYVCVCGERHFFVCSVHILNTLYAQTIEKNVCIETVSYVSERRLEAW